MQTLRTILELLNFTSGIVVAIFAGIALKQLKIAKDNAKITAKREAYKLAADQCSYYFQHVIPLQDKFDSYVKEAKITFFEKAKVEISGKKIGIRILQKTQKEKMEPELKQIAAQLLPVLNCMESFSIFFVNGIASEEVAYRSVGRTFCNATKDLLPFILLVGEGKHWPNVVKLFHLWNGRNEGEQLALSKTQIEKQLKLIESNNIEPIGM